MRGLIAVVVAILVAGCATDGDTGASEVGGTGVGTSTTTTSPPSTTIPTTTVPTTTAAPTTTTSLPPVAGLEAGLFCRDLHAGGHDYESAVMYWAREGNPDRMDADRNGIPCETVYPAADVLAFWGSPLPTSSTTVAPIQLVHVFPLDPPEAGSYSPGGHAYLATDIFAAVGTPFVAVTSGVIQGVSRVDVWDPQVNDGANRSGLYVSLVGDDGVRYYGSHLSEVAAGIAAGVRVEAGQLLGKVGVSGSARDTPPHLHFGISRPTSLDDWEIRRGEVDPIPFLDAWLAGDKTAAPEV